MFPVLPWFEGQPINLAGGIFTTGSGLSASMLYFLNRTTGWRSATAFTISTCYANYTSVDAFSTSLFIHYSIDLLYCESMSHSHIILAGWCHIPNWYCKSFSRHLCTAWGIFDSHSKDFWSPLKSDSTVNTDTHKYFLIFPIAHLTVASSPKNIYLDFSSGNTVDIEMK